MILFADSLLRRFACAVSPSLPNCTINGCRIRYNSPSFVPFSCVNIPIIHNARVALELTIKDLAREIECNYSHLSEVSGGGVCLGRL